MKALIVSDVHSNLEAFSSVIEDAGERSDLDEIWSLGDLVGYGPDPAAVIDLLREHKHRAVAGNHDLACVGKLSLEAFNQHAAAANTWTGDVLDEERAQFLRNQPLSLEVDEFTIVHGSPRDPIWEYVVSERAALACFNHFETYWCLVGHSHIPFICRLSEDPRGVRFFAPQYGVPYPMGDQRLIVNPGGLGQPRDGDPRAAYAVYDTDEDTITHYRVEYDIAATQQKMRSRGLPEFLIDRLPLGH